jgi:cell division protein FtsL
VKKTRKKEPTRFFHFLLILFLLCVAAGISHVWVNFKRTQAGYELSRLKEEIANAEEFNQKLKLEIAFLKSPEHLEKMTRELGLRYPSPEQIVNLP